MYLALAEDGAVALFSPPGRYSATVADAVALGARESLLHTRGKAAEAGVGSG